MLAEVVKGVFVGSGSEGLQQAEVCSAILSLTRKAPEDCKVVYLGTATYDLLEPQAKQCGLLEKAGCKVDALHCVNTGDVTAEMAMN